MRFEEIPDQTTVLVVGAGPIGLLASVLLQQQGIDHALIERRDEVQQAPAAHVVNARTFEIMRAAGIDMDRLLAACRPTADGWTRWVTTLTGEELGCLEYERQQQVEDLYDITPNPLRNLSQHLLEPILRDHASQLVTGTEWQSAALDDSGIVTTIRNVADGTERSIRSRYVIAADGAGSRVRKWTGIEMEGPQRLQAFIAIHVAADLRHLVAHRPATLYWMIDPEIGGTYLAHDIDGTWVYMTTWDPDTESIEDYTEERCLAMFRRGIGAEVANLELRTVSSWNMSSQIAATYSQDNVFLAGDAAHRFPPTGGMGLNTGAADVQNLVWKLAAVEHGWAAPSLLQTYGPERRRVAEVNAEKSLNNAMKMFEVIMALGADPDPAVSKANYERAISTTEGRAALSAAIENQAEHFDMLGLQLGFAYPAEAGITIDDNTELPVPNDIVRGYLPTTHPGARLPHAWVQRNGERISTLDLVPLDRFVLLTSSPAWADAARAITGGPIPLDVVLIGNDVNDTEGHWARVSDLPIDGAIVIRPDQHVGARFAHESGDMPQLIHHALDRMTGAV